MFTSALQQEGKSTTLANLAVALAATGIVSSSSISTFADRRSPRSSMSTG